MPEKPAVLLDALKEAYGPEAVELLRSFLGIPNPTVRSQLLKLAKTLADDAAGITTETNGAGP